MQIPPSFLWILDILQMLHPPERPYGPGTGYDKVWADEKNGNGEARLRDTIGADIRRTSFFFMHEFG
jgi:hypothetical protein